MPWSIAQALESFQQVGTISQVNSTTVRIIQTKQNFRISTDVSIEKHKVAAPTMADFKRGDNVIMVGRILSGVYYVDRLLFIPNLEKLGQGLQ